MLVGLSPCTLDLALMEEADDGAQGPLFASLLLRSGGRDLLSRLPLGDLFVGGIAAKHHGGCVLQGERASCYCRFSATASVSRIALPSPSSRVGPMILPEASTRMFVGDRNR
jgi:hypothetical protein